jgi:hypothetical protein
MKTLYSPDENDIQFAILSGIEKIQIDVINVQIREVDALTCFRSIRPTRSAPCSQISPFISFHP